MAGRKAALLHADPPYGMGKESEGVANDNLRGRDLDAFQRAWWDVAVPFLSDNASAYVWGWEHNLCLFYVSILLPLLASKRVTCKNWIVWNKANGQGISQDGMRRYPALSEHCLFFAFGAEIYNTNANNYWRGWEPLRSALAAAMDAQGWRVKDLDRITGTKMGRHWVTESQWGLPTLANYQKLLEAAPRPDAFPPYANLLLEYINAKSVAREQRAEFYAGRTYFDNTHDAMTDVWRFARVTGDERHGHATPKPVAMMERCMRSSLPEGGLCFEPFGGSGSTLMGAETTGRVCYTMELLAKHVDVIVRRWEIFTGKKATLDGDGRTFEAIAAERTAAQ